MSIPVVRKKVGDAVEGAVVQIITIDCESTAQVDDNVRINTSIINRVDVALENTDPRPVIGTIIEKISPTVCRVAVSGVIPDPDGTTPGILYLGNDGRFTNTPPGPGHYRQKLGYSFGNGFLDLKPEKTLILTV